MELSFVSPVIMTFTTMPSGGCRIALKANVSTDYHKFITTPRHRYTLLFLTSMAKVHGRYTTLVRRCDE